ncbi:hypothetical protein [Mucilaginibacter sp. CSA2-8R]|uniref:hypothetical protein n=1 Tax=Mucilaginibacter sp. CSA2-8R TaxID=3141542 RepID=UPI00315C7C22
MKYIIIAGLILLTIACNSSGSKEHRAQSAIKLYMRGIEYDGGSYQPISFDTLTYDTTGLYWQENREGIKLDSVVTSLYDTVGIFNRKVDSLLNKAPNRFQLRQAEHYKSIAERYNKKAMLADSILQSKGAKYKGKTIHYNMVHTFRADFGFGSKGVFKRSFKLDTGFTVIDFSEMDVKK